MAGARTTELDAVNTILSAVGEPPITSLSDPKNADAAIAQNVLTEITREIQTMGWHFNTQYNVAFQPDASKQIVLAENIVRIDLVDHGIVTQDVNRNTTVTDTRDITQRGDKLFDRTNNTYDFETEVVATVIYLLDFTELPEPARRYATIKAARVFQDRMVGSQKHHMFSREDETRALALLKEFEGETGDRTIFDNHDVHRIIGRLNTSRSLG
tara:strand:+ start:8915 stop:9553 length:639 start_codon:yes stop_codon:yes gene_type:complete